MCGQRGLMPNTENQTFEMAIPHALREQYAREYAPIGAADGNMVSTKRVMNYIMSIPAIFMGASAFNKYRI